MTHAKLRKLLRVMARFSVLGLGVFVVLLVGAVVLAYFFSDNLIRYFSNQVEKQLNVKITYSKASVRGTTLYMNGLQLQTRGGAPLARVDELVAPLNPYYGILYGPSRWVGDISLTGTRVDIAVSPESRLNWDNFTLPRRISEGPIESMYRGRIQLKDGMLSFRDQRQGDYLAQIDRIDGNLIWEPDRSWTVQSTAQGGALKVNAVGRPEKPIEVRADLTDLELDDYLSYPAVTESFQVEGARVNGRLELQVPPAERYRTLAFGTLQLQARELSVTRLGQTVGPVRAQVKLSGSALRLEKTRLHWHGQPIDIQGQLRANMEDLASSWLKLEVKAGPASLLALRKRFPRLKLPEVKGRASIDLIAEGQLPEPAVQGRIRAWDVELAQFLLRTLVADFELDADSLHLRKVVAHTADGQELNANGWLFRDKEQNILFRFDGVPPELGSISPWLAGSDEVRALALGTLKDPVVTGQARLASLPANPLGLSGGISRFWLDGESAFLWDGRLWGGGGEVQVPRAVVDYRQGDLAAEVLGRDLAVSTSQGEARISGSAEISGNFKTQQFEATAYSDNSSVRAPGLPPVDGITGAVAYQNGEILVPHLEATSNGERVAVTGNLYQGRGSFFLEAPTIDASRWVAGAPAGARSLSGVAHIDGREVSGFKLVTRGPGGDAWAVGHWVPGLGPELYAQFADLTVPGQDFAASGDLATAWSNGRLHYFYGARPQNSAGKSPEDSWLAGRGTIQGTRLAMLENFLHLPQAGPALPSIAGEGRAYSYFGPSEGTELIRRQIEPEPWQYGGSLGWNGDYDLRRRSVNVDLRARNLNLTQISSWFGPLQSPAWWRSNGLTLEDMLIDVDAHARGPVRDLDLQAALRSPWTRISRKADGLPESLAFSWRSDATYRKRNLTLLSLLSPHSQDYQLLSWKGPRQSPPDPDWLRTRLAIDPAFHLQGWIRAEAFPMATARWVVPPALAAQLPSGVLSTDDRGLQLSGSLDAPQVAGRVDLRDGQFWTGYRYLPIDEAYADFASNQRATSLTRLRVQSGGLTLEGRGNRTNDGTITAQLWADDLPLETLADFGFSTQGWTGTVDGAFSFIDADGIQPQAWVALQADKLQAPENSPFAIERLLFGKIDRELDGLPYTGPGKGVALRMEGGEMIVEFPPEVTELVFANPEQSRLSAEGRLSWRALPGARQSVLDWARSKNGPRFGAGAHPLRLSMDRFSWPLLRPLLGLSPDRRSGLVSASLELLGQYFEQHRLDNPKLGDKPLARLDVADFLLEGPGAIWSGARLREPFQLTYRVVPGAGWLNLSAAALEFFKKAAPDAPAQVRGTLESQASLVVMDNPGLKKGPASLSPDQNIQAVLKDVPLENLAFLFPALNRLGGTIARVEVDQRGPLSQPTASFQVDAQSLQIQGLNITAVQGKATLASQEPGKIQLQLGTGAEELRMLLGGANDLNQALRLQGQALLDFDRLIALRSSSLTPVLQGWSMSERSQFDLSAQLNDPQMRLLEAVAPVNSTLGGTFKGELNLKGSAAQPELTGLVALENGSFAHPRLQTPLTQFNTRLRFERIGVELAEPSPVLDRLQTTTLGRYTLERFEGNLGGAPFRGQGKAEIKDLEPTYANFTLDGDGLAVRWDGLLDGRANIHLNLTGVPDPTAEQARLRPYLAGSIEIPEADLQLPSKETMAELKALSGGEGTASRLPPLDYNIDLRLGEDVWGNYLNSSVRASGDLKLTPSQAGKPALNGSLLLSRGVLRIPFYEVNFRIRQGYAVFEDDVMPRLENLEADANFGQYQVTARIDGKYPDLKIEMVSNPPMADSDLRNMVVTGGMPGTSTNAALTGNSNTQGGNFVVNQGMSVLSNLVTGAVTQGLGRLLALSELSLDVQPTSGYVIRVAKSLDAYDRFLLTFAQVVGGAQTRYATSTSQYGIEWRFQPNLLTRVSMDNNGTARLWFQGVLRY